MWVGTRLRLWASSVILPQATPARVPPSAWEKPRRALVDLVSRFLLWLTRVLYFRDGGYVPYTAVLTYMDTSAHTSIAGGKGAEWISQLMKGDE